MFIVWIRLMTMPTFAQCIIQSETFDPLSSRCQTTFVRVFYADIKSAAVRAAHLQKGCPEDQTTVVPNRITHLYDDKRLSVSLSHVTITVSKYYYFRPGATSRYFPFPKRARTLWQIRRL